MQASTRRRSFLCALIAVLIVAGWYMGMLDRAAPAYAGIHARDSDRSDLEPARPEQENPRRAHSLKTDRPPVLPETTREGVLDIERHGPAAVPSTPVPRSPDEGTAANAPGTFYGMWVMTPALVAIVLAIVTRQVVVALVAGILVAAGMMLGWRGHWGYNPVTCVTYAVDHYLFGVLASLKTDGTVDLDHLKILVFTFLIGGMVGVIEANGGTRAMVARVARRIGTRQKGQLGAFGAGLVVFFDDYANAMIIGPSMRPIFDRLRLSREKLAYIVDSTAAPVSSLFIGTWLAAEIGYLDQGLNSLEHRPAFLEGITGASIFWASIPYRTYAWMAMFLVFLIALTGRDFGSMRAAESRAISERKKASNSREEATEVRDGPRWWLGAIPVCALIAMTVALLFYTGAVNCLKDGDSLGWTSLGAIRQSIVSILGKADSYPALVYGALVAVGTAVVLTCLTRALSLGKTIDAAVAGMGRMFSACVVLVLAWGLSQGGKDLQLGEVASAYLNAKVAAGVFSPMWLSLVVFIAASLVSFATGTSWGTMGILCPAVIAVAAGMLDGMPTDQALPIFYASAGAVLTGAVFGDHCSPISDTTVLSSIASECDLGRHVWTQMPYALTAAAVGLLCTDGLNLMLARWAPTFQDAYWKTPYGLLPGGCLMLLIVMLMGRRPKGIVAEPAVTFGV